MGNPKEACTLLRMPEEDMPLPPQDIPSYFYKEEVIIRDDEEDEQNEEEEKKKKRSNGNKRRYRPRPTYRWVLEALETKLHGTSSTIKAKDGSAYFILRVDEQTRETRLVPLTEVIMLRQTAPEGEDEEEGEEGGEGGGRRKAAKEFIEHGNRFDQRAEAWAKRYGRRLVDVLNVGGGSDSEDEYEDGGEGGARKRRRKRGGKKPWQRTYRVDEDADAGEMDHNPSTKVGTSYQDVFGLMEEERKGGRRGEEREALAVAFETVDTGGDVPDGADEGFGAPEFGDEYCQPEHRVAARELEEGGGREGGARWGEEVLFEEESGIEGYRSSSESEEEEEEEEGRQGGLEGWKRGKVAQRGPAAFEAQFAGLMKEGGEEGGEGEEGSSEEDDDDQYLGDDDDSSSGSGSEGEERKGVKGKKKEEVKGKKKGGSRSRCP